MNGSGPSVGNLSIGYRALAVLVAGIQFLAVGALLFEIVLGLKFPGLRSFTDSLGISALLLLVAYLCGLAVDNTATKLWNFIGREGLFAFRRGQGSEGKPKDWMAERTDLNRYPVLDELEPWLRAQEWFWRSPRAAAEAGDLRLRLMLGKASALNAGLAWLLTLVALAAVPLRTELNPTPGASVVKLAVTAGFTGFALWWSLWGTMTRPDIKSPLTSLRRWWLTGFLALATCWLWGQLRAAEVGLPAELRWVALGAAFGPVVVFAFIYVRLDTNALYHRMVRDAAWMEEPDAGDVVA